MNMAACNRQNFGAVCTFLLMIICIFSRFHVLVSAEKAPTDSQGDHGHSDSVFGDPFEDILKHLEENVWAGTVRNITSEDTGKLIQSLFEDRMRCSDHLNATTCQQCLTADSLFSILQVSPSNGLDEKNFQRACVVLMYYVTRLGPSCENTFVLAMQPYEYFANGLQIRGDGLPKLSEEEFEAMLDFVNSTYVADNFAKCFTAETIFETAVANHETGADEHELESVAAILMSSLLRGYCIGEASILDPDAFLDDIFDVYATNGVMTEENFIEILKKLSIGGEFETEMDDSHNHARKRRSTHVRPLIASAFKHQHRRRRETGHAHGDERNESDVKSCFTADQLFEVFGVNHNVGVTRQQFKDLSPALIQQSISDACVHNETTVLIRPSAAQVWGYGILAVFVISLCAVAGVAFLPCLNTSLYLKVLQTMMALAVATLVGDAIIHLIPQAVGLHAHDVASSGGGSQSAQSHGAASEELAFIWKCLVVVAAIYLFFVFESLMRMFGGGHSHSLEPEDNPTERKRASSMKLKEAVNGSFRKSESNTQLENNSEYADAEENSSQQGHSHAPKVCFGLGTLPFMILIGDGLHNLGDGLAIGAAFATSMGAGLSTSIAVLCHELPHELGDFAVLLNAGLSFRKALCFNFLSAMMAFVGLCIGIPLAANQEAREWIFAVAAGMFLYVALVDMLPELIHHELKNKGQIFLLHNLGFLIGSAIILVIALYEDSINISIS